MANEPHELSSAEDGGQVCYPVLPSPGLAEEIQRLLQGEVNSIDLKLRAPNSTKAHYARIVFPGREALRKSRKFQDSWAFGHAQYQEIDLDGREIGEPRSCNGSLTPLNIPYPGEVCVRTTKERR